MSETSNQVSRSHLARIRMLKRLGEFGGDGVPRCEGCGAFILRAGLCDGCAAKVEEVSAVVEVSARVWVEPGDLL